MDQTGPASFVDLRHLHAHSGLEGGFLEHNSQILTDFQEAEFLGDDHHQVEEGEDEQEDGFYVAVVGEGGFFDWVCAVFNGHGDVDEWGQDDWEGGEDGTEQDGTADTQNIVFFVFSVDVEQLEEVIPLEFALGFIFGLNFILAILSSFFWKMFDLGLSLCFLFGFDFFLRFLDTFHDCEDIAMVNFLGFSFVDFEDFLGFGEGFDSVGNHDYEGDVWACFEVVEDCFLVDGVESWGAFVEDEDFGVTEDGSGDGQTLFLSAWDCLEGGVEAEFLDEIGHAAHFQHFPDPLVVQFSVSGKDFLHGPAKQYGFLPDVPNSFPQAWFFNIFDGLIDGIIGQDDASFKGLIKFY
jgi:hypothetical protein